MRMSENDTINPADTNQQVSTEERPKAVNQKLISGKEVFITAYTHTRGKAGKYHRPDQIGADNKVDYWTFATSESFSLPPKKGEAPEAICNFFTTEAVSKQIERIPDYANALAQGKRIGPVKVVLRKSNKEGGNDYWCLAFENDEDYK
jgi:hypothetical protein